MTSPVNYPDAPVLLVDDEEQVLRSTSFSLRLAGIATVTCEDSRRVPELLKETPVSAVLLDLLMPHKSGYDLLPAIRDLSPESPVVVMTAVNEVESAVRCMKEGAFDYLIKPVQKAELLATVKKAIGCWELSHEHARLKEYFLSGKFENPEAFSEIVARSPAMLSLFRYLEAIATTPMPILITGESGVGKELIARAAHRSSKRTGSFVAVNVAGLDDNLFSDTLFGHKAGAFTGASGARDGLVQKAADGTLFLDEIGDLAIESQVKLLRLLEDRTYYPVGSDTPRTSTARIIAATNKPIDQLRRSDTFRSDLYYRLKAHHVHIPPLRERKEDIPLLVDVFLERIAEELDKPTPTPPREIYPLMKSYSFPGNVRELKSMLYDAVGRHESRMLSLQPIRDAIAAAGEQVEPTDAVADGDQPVTFGERLPTLREVGNLLVQEALRRADGNQSIAAQMVGLTRSALNKRINKGGE